MPQTRRLLLTQQPAQHAIEMPSPNYMIRTIRKTSKAKDQTNIVAAFLANTTHFSKNYTNYKETKANTRTTDWILKKPPEHIRSPEGKTKTNTLTPGKQKYAQTHKTKRCNSLQPKHHTTDKRRKETQRTLTTTSPNRSHDFL